MKRMSGGKLFERLMLVNVEYAGARLGTLEPLCVVVNQRFFLDWRLKVSRLVSDT